MNVLDFSNLELTGSTDAPLGAIQISKESSFHFEAWKAISESVVVHRESSGSREAPITVREGNSRIREGVRRFVKEYGDVLHKLSNT